ncbi:MAG: FMN-binding negative transcriptional regulator [Aggregatilineales bacterium]
MYIPRINQMPDHDEILSFMRQYSFAILVSVNEGIPVATHLPVTVHEQGEAEPLILRSHLAKANPQWQTLDSQECLVIFSAPHAYISTQHYDKVETVPTWNYMAVHAYGQAEVLTFESAPERLESILSDLIMASEAAYQQQWDGLSARYHEGMMRGIVGIEMTVTRLEGKAKLSQNKNQDEQARIADHLLMQDDTAARETGQAMQQRLTE